MQKLIFKEYVRFYAADLYLLLLGVFAAVYSKVNEG